MRPLLYGQGHGAPPCTVRPGLLPEVKLPPLLCFRGGRARADVRMGPGISAAVSASAAGDSRGVARARLRARRGGRAWGARSEARGTFLTQAWVLFPRSSGLEVRTPLASFPVPFREPHVGTAGRGVSPVPLGGRRQPVASEAHQGEGGDVASTLLGRGPPDAACGNASRSIRFLIEVRLGFKSN